MVCSKCKCEKPAEDFAWKNSALGKKHSSCKICHKQVRKSHYERNSQKQIDSVYARKRINAKALQSYKSGLFCETCGESHPAALDFHHVSDKEIGIAQAVGRGWSVSRIMKEIAKCLVLCANCHRKEHYELRV